MTRSALSRRGAPKQAGMRLALALVAAALGYMAVMHSLAMVIQKRSLSEAHALAPGNGLITGRLADNLASSAVTTEGRDRAGRLARLALRQDPTAIEAVVVLGVNALIRGDTSAARSLFAYSEALSRRNLSTQMWAINTLNNVSAVLLHYDIALRTSQQASATLFPVLTSAIADPTLRDAVAVTLAQRPPWANAFMNYVVGNSAQPEVTVALFEELLHRGVAIPDRDTANLINALINANKPDRAWAYYAAIHSGADRRLSRDPTFMNETGAPSPLDWMPINNGGISSAIQPNDAGKNVLTFVAPPSIGGAVVEQFELLPAGNYVLEGQSQNIDQSDDARPYWSLRCRNGRELGRANVPNSAIANGHFDGRFVVPGDCPVQILALNIRPSSRVSGITGQIIRARLRPAG